MKDETTDVALTLDTKTMQSFVTGIYHEQIQQQYKMPMLQAVFTNTNQIPLLLGASQGAFKHIMKQNFKTQKSKKD